VSESRSVASVVSDSPKCEKCGLECTTGMMAAFCSKGRECEFWPHSNGEVALAGAELLMYRFWMDNALEQIALQIEDRKQLDAMRAEALEEVERLRKRLSESASSLEAAQKQIEHVKGGRDSAHMARKEARKDRTEAVELLQRASVYAHGVRWPQELFDAVRALLTKYENGLKLLEGPK
jgi:hypothetical protein